MNVDKNRTGAAVWRDAVGWEGVIADEVEFFAGAGVKEAAAAWRAHAFGCNHRDWLVEGRERCWEGDVFQLDRREVCLELGGGFRGFSVDIVGDDRHGCLKMKSVFLSSWI